jgi:hypothetical protein
VLLVFALDSCIDTLSFTHNINAEVLSLERKRFQDVGRYVRKAPHIGEAFDVAKVENAEVFEDITSNFLVVTGSHFGKGMRRFIVPPLALCNKRIEEVRRTPKKETVKSRFHLTRGGQSTVSRVRIHFYEGRVGRDPDVGKFTCWAAVKEHAQLPPNCGGSPHTLQQLAVFHPRW